MLQPVFATLVGLLLGLAATWLAGENPLHVLGILSRGAFGSPYDVGWTLVYTTPLIFTGLSVAVAFHAGLFNIGAEGQLTLGALAAAVVGALLPNLSAPWAPLLASAAAVCAAGLWGAIPGWLKASRGSHEVINCIMLNFVAGAFASYVTLQLLPNLQAQNPETALIGAGYVLQPIRFFDGAPVSVALPLAVLVALAVSQLLWNTTLGFEIRAVGENERAAELAGISARKIKVVAFTIAGGLAGLVAVSEVLGNSGRFKLGFSPDYGFMGIAVALLGRNRPAGIVAAALLFGALHKGAAELDLETEHVTRELSLIFQGLILLCVSAEGLWDWTQRRRHSRSDQDALLQATKQ